MNWYISILNQLKISSLEIYFYSGPNTTMFKNASSFFEVRTSNNISIMMSRFDRLGELENSVFSLCSVLRVWKLLSFFICLIFNFFLFVISQKLVIGRFRFFRNVFQQWTHSINKLFPLLEIIYDPVDILNF